MLEQLTGLTESVFSVQITMTGLMLCTAASLFFGFCVAAVHTFKNRYSKNFIITLVLLPGIVQIVIMLVNRNIGAGIAVAGAFSLVRFRSIPGGARDIGSVFFAMAMGFITGMGYLLYGLFFLTVISAVTILLVRSPFGEGTGSRRFLKITIPEDLDYEGLFDGVFAEYAVSAELDRVRTIDMGSLYELTYKIALKASVRSKAFIDALRCLNGNLPISLNREQTYPEEL